MEEKEVLLNDIKNIVKQNKEEVDSAIKLAQDNFKGAELEVAIKELKDIALAQGETLAKMKNQGETSKKTIKDQLLAQSDVIKRIQSGDYTAKATVLPASVSQANTGMTLAEIGQIQTRKNVIPALFTQSGIAQNNQRTITYLEQTTRTNAAAARTIGAAAAESTLAWTKADLTIKSYSHFIPVALEMLDDYDFIQNEINQFLLSDLLLSVEGGSWNGAGTTNLLKGVYTSAAAWADPSIDFAFATGAGMIELIQTCITQISNNTKFQANYVLMNNYDALKLKLQRNALGNLEFPNFMGPDGMSIEGVQIIPTPLVTANTLLVGDFTQGTMYSRPASIQIGLNGTDFTERQVSILANIDVALLIKSVQATAFVKVADVAASIALIKQA